jgi:hypothetical protein
MTADIGFILILLDKVLAGPGINFPVDVSDIVSRVIVPIVGKLHAESAVGAFVKAG